MTPLSTNKLKGFTGPKCQIPNVFRAPYGFTGPRGERGLPTFPGRNEMPLPNMPLPKLPSVNESKSHPCSSVKFAVKVARPFAVRDFCCRLGATTEDTVVVCKGDFLPLGSRRKECTAEV